MASPFLPLLPSRCFYQCLPKVFPCSESQFLAYMYAHGANVVSVFVKDGCNLHNRFAPYYQAAHLPFGGSKVWECRRYVGMLHFAQRHTLFDSPYEVSLGAFADMIEEVVDVAVALTPPHAPVADKPATRSWSCGK